MTAAAGVAVMGFAIRRWLPSTPFLRDVLLEPPAAGPGTTPPALEQLVGVSGVTTTRLAPAGKARIGDVVREVVADGTLVEPGVAVRVVDVRGGRVLVRPS